MLVNSAVKKAYINHFLSCDLLFFSYVINIVPITINIIDISLIIVIFSFKKIIDNINKKDDTMPFGISTDYDKLKSETKKYYENNDAIFVELGDTYRLDEFRKNLNENLTIY